MPLGILRYCLLATIVTIVSCGQTKTKSTTIEEPLEDSLTIGGINHWNWFNLKGPIKKLEVEAFRVENKFGKIEKGLRDDVEAISLYPGSKYSYLNENIINLFGFKPVKEIFFFDPKGYLTKIDQYNANGDKEIVKRFIYDQEKHLTRVAYQEIINSSNEIQNVIQTPTESGSILEMQQKNGDAVLIKLIEVKGKIREVVFGNKYGEVEDHIKLHYSGHPFPSELVAFDEYNDEEGTLQNEFDENHHLLSSAMSASESELDLHIEFNYENWDDQGNWIKLMVTESGKERQIIERVVEYY